MRSSRHRLRRGCGYRNRRAPWTQQPRGEGWLHVARGRAKKLRSGRMYRKSPSRDEFSQPLGALAIDEFGKGDIARRALIDPNAKLLFATELRGEPDATWFAHPLVLEAVCHRAPVACPCGGIWVKPNGTFVERNLGNHNGVIHWFTLGFHHRAHGFPGVSRRR